MDISPYTVIPFITIVITQIVQFARASFDVRRPVWSSLVNLRGPHSPLLAYAVALIGVSMAVGGQQSALLSSSVLLALIVYRQDQTTKRSARDYFWTIGTAISAAYVLSYDYWGESLEWFMQRPTDDEATKWLYGFGAIAVLAFLVSGRFRRKNLRKLPTSRRIQRAINTTVLLPALFGVGITYLQSQTRNEFLTDRIYSWLPVVAILLSSIWAIFTVYSKAGGHLAEEKAHFLKEQKKQKRKKRSKKHSKKH